MNIQFWIKQQQYNKFLSTCSAVIRNVGAGTKAATEEACAEIMSDSLSQVPIDTGTLASTAYYLVRRRGDTAGYRYEGVVGYAGMGGVDGWMQTADAINPKTGKPASRYSAVVHEDLSMPHIHGGKAKFLEDPVREYGQAKFRRVAEQYWRVALTMHEITKTGRGGRQWSQFVRGPSVQQKVNYRGTGDVWAHPSVHSGKHSFNLGKSNKGNY